MTARSGVTPMSAGTPKLSMKTGAGTMPTPPSAAPLPVFSPVEAEPEPIAVAVVEDEDPFGAVHIEPEPHVEEHENPFSAADNPFGAPTEVHDAGAEREELEELLASARAVTATLEEALHRARQHEQQLAERLARL
jgi:hypothetical protein